MIARQRVLLSDDETCRHCGTPSRQIHPAGVVPGTWTCTRCGLRQNELSTDEIVEHTNVALEAGILDFTNQLEDA